MKFHLALAAGLLVAAPVLAEGEAATASGDAAAAEEAITVTGDAAAGEKAFKKCVSCHVVVNDAGETLAGKKAKTGPNLYGVAGRAAASVEGFRYSKSIQAAGEAGLVWTEDKFVTYVQDPTAFLREELGDSSARSAMSFKVRKEKEALDLYAYLASLAE
jgi:cytochrome c